MTRAAQKEAIKRWGLEDAPTEHELRRRETIIKQRKEFRPIEFARQLLRTPVPAEWEADLRTISPKSDTASWLRLTWMDTPPESPVYRPGTGRWVLYDCVPDALIDTERRWQLTTPFWELPKDQRAGREQMVTAMQFELYRTERVDARAFWVIQGNSGGNPVSFTALERRIFRMHHQPEEPPPRGALPLAPWDARVRDVIVARDRLAKLQGKLSALRASGTPEAMRAAQAEEDREGRRIVMTWLTDQLGEQADYQAWYSRRTASDRTLHKITREEAAKAARFTDEYIETGILP